MLHEPLSIYLRRPQKSSSELLQSCGQRKSFSEEKVISKIQINSLVFNVLYTLQNKVYPGKEKRMA